ncbi:PRC-barrel domain-containing protein [Neobacillus sp. D3-1R]|uniref:PRC-barrel domain-containing protein n=1 Tax=Neobacillus sp. D3-1R TaxID=3445778 RepID=UPI003FA17B58
MRTFSLLKGLPVYELKKGKKIGEVCDLSISGSGMVKGLLIKKGGLFKKSLLIDIQDVTSFGWDGVMIEDEDKLETLPNTPEFTLDHQHSLQGKIVMTSEGQKLGILEDVYFLEELGTIVGYEISDGFFSDITEGKQVVKTSDSPAIGKDAIIVKVK